MEEIGASQNESGENDAVDWNLGNSVPMTQKFYVPKGRQTSSVVMVITVLIGMGTVGGMGYYAYKATHKRPPPPIVIAEKTAPSKATPPVARPKALFDIDADQAAARQAQAKQQSGAPVSPAPTTAVPIAKAQQSAAPVHAYKPPPASAIQEDPDIVALRTQAQAFDPAWDEIVNARHDVRHIGASVIKYDAYRRDHRAKTPPHSKSSLTKRPTGCIGSGFPSSGRRAMNCSRKSATRIRTSSTSPPALSMTSWRKTGLTWSLSTTRQTKPSPTRWAIPAIPHRIWKIRRNCRHWPSRDPAKYAAFKTRVLKYVRDYHGAVWWTSP